MNKELLSILRLLHGSFNILVMCLFLFQGGLGLKIRKGRLSGRPRHDLIRLHRKTGPLFSLLAMGGFLFGGILAYLDWGGLMQYPLHFITGFMLISLIFLTFLVSRRIKGDNSARKIHAGLGAGVIIFYVIQVILGLRIVL